jgi:hypothetical protein
MSTMNSGGGPGPDRARTRLRRLAARIGPDVALLRRSREFRLLYAGQMLSFAGSMTGGWTARVSRHGRAIVLAVIAWGAAIALLGLATSLWWAVAALAAAGAADMVGGLFRMTMWNQTIPAA